MATYLAFEVDDVDHWLSSPKREEVFGPLGITIWAFKDTQGSKRVGLICEIPDFAAFQEFMQTEPAAEAMKHDGVHPDTLVILAEGSDFALTAFRAETQHTSAASNASADAPVRKAWCSRTAHCCLRRKPAT